MIDLEYTEIDGLLYPNIQLGDTEIYDDLGKYGRQRLNYLHKQKPQQYRELLFTGKLAQHCAKIEQSAFDMAERVRGQYLEQHPAPAEGMERIQAFEQVSGGTSQQRASDTLQLTCGFVAKRRNGEHIARQAQIIADELVLHDIIYN